MNFDLIYSDDALLVLNKPANLLSVPGRGEHNQDCLSARVQAVFPEALIVHRLDMATSGLIVMARGASAQRSLSIAFQNRKTDKRYIAVVAGKLQQESGQVDLPLIVDWPNRPRQKADQVTGKPSLTHYRLLEYLPELDASRVELEPVTGRSHQLRVHMQACGHAILGDEFYADDVVRAQSPRLLLHATTLTLPHPVGALPLSFSSSVPF